MSLDFIITGFPRSGTMWLSHFFYLNGCNCVHDPLYHWHYTEFSLLCEPNKLNGISCTGIWRFEEWVNSQASKKVIIHRKPSHVHASLAKYGLGTSILHDNDLNKIMGLHIPYEDLFKVETIKEIWMYITDLPFNEELCEYLLTMNIQLVNPTPPNKDIALQNRLYNELAKKQ